MKTKKDLSVPVLLSALLFCAFLPGLQVQAETMYQISETELTQLETNLETLKAHNQERQKVLTEQATLLNQQREELKKIERGNQQLQSSERTDAEIIRESQSILEAVRGRGKKEN